MSILFADAPMPDLVLSGINDGLNVGEDAIYSGTLAYAREATFWGIPAIGFSRIKQHVDGAEDAQHVSETIEAMGAARAV